MTELICRAQKQAKQLVNTYMPSLKLAGSERRALSGGGGMNLESIDICLLVRRIV